MGKLKNLPIVNEPIIGQEAVISWYFRKQEFKNELEKRGLMDDQKGNKKIRRTLEQKGKRNRVLPKVQV